MRILFIPFYKKSHQIPLLVFYKTYFSHLKEFECSFLLPKSDYKYCELYKTRMLDFDFTLPLLVENNKYVDIKSIPSFVNKRNEIIKKYNPNIIIEDFSFDIADFCESNKIARISIQRTGIFRASNPLIRNFLHIHSIEKGLIINGHRQKVLNFKEYLAGSDNLTDKDYYIAKYNLDLSLENVFNPEVKIIPGIASIEKLPLVVEMKSYHYSGPLIPDDDLNHSLLNKLKDFLHEHKREKKVFLTTGLIEQQDTSEIFKHLVKRGYAIISTIFPPFEVDKSKIFYNNFLPLHFISDSVDLMIHHCGSGMYHYPLLHLKPAITIGTQCYDREEVALQLQNLQLSAHVPSKYDDINYMGKFIDNIDKFEQGNLCNYNILSKIRNEIIDTSQQFDVKNFII